MTETTGGIIGNPARHHMGELKLRRFLAGESLEGERDTVTAHAAGCAECSRRIDALMNEQRKFEERISFDRFTAGVERAARVPGPVTGRHWWARPASTRSFVTVISMASLAACFALVVGVRPLFESARLRREAVIEGERVNRTKGAGRAAVTVRIAPPDEGPQRTAAAEDSEALAVGERIRVGVQPGGRHFLFAISMDDSGAVTPLYPEVGTSMPLPPGRKLQYLPDSLELTGKGSERLIVLLTDVPIEMDDVRRAAAASFSEAGGNIARLRNLSIAGDQFHRMFLKP